jgi:hypothetical protein
MLRVLIGAAGLSPSSLRYWLVGEQRSWLGLDFIQPLGMHMYSGIGDFPRVHEVAVEVHQCRG